MADLTIRPLWGPDLGNGFLESLRALRPVDLTPEAAAVIFRRRLAAGVRTFVALDDGAVVGTASLVPEEKFYGRVGRIEDVAVRSECQKKGVGSALVRRAVGEAKLLKCYKVILDCTDAVAPFYERLGFRRHNNSLRLDVDAGAVGGAE